MKIRRNTRSALFGYILCVIFSVFLNWHLVWLKFGCLVCFSFRLHTSGNLLLELALSSLTLLQFCLRSYCTCDFVTCYFTWLTVSRVILGSKMSPWSPVIIPYKWSAKFYAWHIEQFISKLHVICLIWYFYLH